VCPWVYAKIFIVLHNYCISEIKTLFLKPEEEKDKTHFTDKEVKYFFEIMGCMGWNTALGLLF
jgi:hypothetical protein